MSIKIRNGYRIKKEIFDDINSFNQIINKYKADCFQSALLSYSKLLEENLSSFFLDYFLNDFFRDEFSLSSNHQLISPDLYNVSIIDIIINSNIVDNNFFNSFILFYPSKKFFLCIINNDFNNTLPSIFEPYIYFNSSDKPDSISHYEWNRREKLWKEALKQPENIVDIISPEINKSIILNSLNRLTTIDLYKKLKIKAYDKIINTLRLEQPSLSIFECIEDINDGKYEKELSIIFDDIKEKLHSQYVSIDYLKRFKFDVIKNKITFKGIC